MFHKYNMKYKQFAGGKDKSHMVHRLVAVNDIYEKDISPISCHNNYYFLCLSYVKKHIRIY